MTARRYLGIALATAAALATATPALAATPSPDPGAQPVPLLGTTSYRVVALDAKEIRVGMLAVARIAHGTVVYYALAPNKTGDAEVFAMDTPSLKDPFPAMAAAKIDIVDAKDGVLYQPLMAGGHCLCSDTADLQPTDASGTPTVGYAVFPELPADITQATVRFGHRAFFTGLPVTDTVPAGTTAAAPVPLGEWPELPTEETIAAGDVKQATRPLTTNTAEPTAATSVSPTRTTVALASDVLFATDHSDLNAKATDALSAVADEMNAKGQGTVTIDGYTDDVGTDAHNQALSEARAASVLKALKPLVTNPDVTFTTAGHGENDPVADNGTAEGRQQNRRVTVSFETGAEQ